ncbi:MAG: hypothetical protein NWE92_02740 [Candidatus Bathyarchaeota archaeon]|nr:hypothetical protein [Candidatus Bathyarchaeota archaeon]
MATASTYFYVERVEKFSYATPKQTLKIVVTTKSSFPPLQSCGVP